MQAKKKMTRSEFNSMVENWYGRLNKLKLFVWNNPSHPKIDKACDLAAQMAVRLVELSHIYQQMTMPKSTPNYPSGGVKTFPQTIEELAGFSFFILDLREKKSIAVECEEGHGYTGVSFQKENDSYNLSPYYVARGFISMETDRYDFTQSFDIALQHCS